MSAATPHWVPFTWQGERAQRLDTPSWTAIVSEERDRLVHFGPPGGARNLLFATATKQDEAGWSGHRVWLGPQHTWSSIWPPPDAWEKSAAEKVIVDGARLELVVPDAGDGWPRFTRIYEIDNGRLAARVRLAAGGTRAAQVFHILQTPQATRVELRAAPDARHPLGFVRLPITDEPFASPPHIERAGDVLHLRHIGQDIKLGFVPQDILAHAPAGGTLRVAIASISGPVLDAPDAGFDTQVYLGRTPGEPFIELEQLSPRWQPGAAGEISLLLDILP